MIGGFLYSVFFFYFYELLLDVKWAGDFFLGGFIVLNNWGSFDVIVVGCDFIRESLFIFIGLESYFKKIFFSVNEFLEYTKGFVFLWFLIVIMT